MLVRDDRAWVGGGRTDPWIGLFDAVLGKYNALHPWLCSGALEACPLKPAFCCPRRKVY